MRYWKIAPGDSARFWQRCLSDNNIAVGWSSANDLSQVIDNFEKFKSLYIQFYPNDPQAQQTKKMNELWNFLHLKPGDKIIANNGMTSIVGIGEVLDGGYSYRKDYQEYRHTIPVRWIETIEREIPEWAKEIVSSWFGFTIRELSQEEFNTLTMSATEVKSYDVHRSHKTNQVLITKKQIILYGPPGTGKTYNTKNIAVSVLEGFDYALELVEYDEAQPEKLVERKGVDNLLFNKIETFILGLSGIEAIPRQSMIGYYSLSKRLNKKIGLVWLAYPARTTGFFPIHFRKEDGVDKYSSVITDSVVGYKRNGWGGYPQFIIRNEDDANKAIELIKFAYENL